MRIKTSIGFLGHDEEVHSANSLRGRHWVTIWCLLIHEQGKSDGNAQEETLRDALLL